MEKYPIKLGYYKHYKGHLIIVVGVSLHTENKDPFVTYIHVGSDTEGRVNGLWSRPYDMFHDENVEWEGKTYPKRFEYIGENI